MHLRIVRDALYLVIQIQELQLCPIDAVHSSYSSSRWRKMHSKRKKVPVRRSTRACSSLPDLWESSSWPCQDPPIVAAKNHQLFLNIKLVSRCKNRCVYTKCKNEILINIMIYIYMYVYITTTNFQFIYQKIRYYYSKSGQTPGGSSSLLTFHLIFGPAAAFFGKAGCNSGHLQRRKVDRLMHL